MNRIALVAAVAALILPVAASGAQADKPAAEKGTPAAKGDKAAAPAPAAKAEKPAPATKAEPAGAAAKPEPAAKKDEPKPAPAAEKMASADKPKRGPSRANEDARACLEQPTNREVAICAEKFR
jgi:hypothetical protein